MNISTYTLRTNLVSCLTKSGWPVLLGAHHITFMITVRHAEGTASAECSATSQAGARSVAPAAQGGTRIAFIWRAAVNSFVPVAYEDETGFHFGEAPFSKTHPGE
jgi:hypothetical protein